MGDTDERTVFLLQLLHEGESPTLTFLRPFPTGVNPLLDAVLIDATGPNVLLQSSFSFGRKFINLALSSLVDRLKRTVRATNRTNPNMLRVQLINHADNPFNPFTRFKVKIIPKRTPDSSFLIPSKALYLLR